MSEILIRYPIFFLSNICIDVSCLSGIRQISTPSPMSIYTTCDKEPNLFLIDLEGLHNVMCNECNMKDISSGQFSQDFKEHLCITLLMKYIINDTLVNDVWQLNVLFTFQIASSQPTSFISQL